MFVVSALRMAMALSPAIDHDMQTEARVNDNGDASEHAGCETRD
jgi:hypothetical protein